MEMKVAEVAPPPSEEAAFTPPVEKRTLNLRPPKTPAAPAKVGTPEKTETPAPAAASTAPAADATPGGQGDKPAEKTEEPQKPTGREFAALKRERQRANEAKAKAEAVLAEAAKYQDAIASKDARKIMAALGLTDEQLVDMYINASKGDGASGEKPSDDENSPLGKKLKELEARVASEAKARQDAEVKAGVAGAVARFEAAAGTDKERWAAVSDQAAVKAATDGQYNSAGQLAFDVAWEHFQATGEHLPIEDVLDHVEDYLISEQLRRSADVKARRALLASLKSQSSTGTQNPGAQASASPAATGVVQRTNVTNSASSVAAGKPRGPSRGELADRRFFERVAALSRGSG